MARFAYTITCTGCGRQWHDEVTGVSWLFNPVTDLDVACLSCGPLDVTIARRIPTSPKVEQRQLAAPRTPLRGRPRRRG
jgi:hypothetical protein